MDASPHILGDITAERFLERHWQREPLLVRNALPGYASPLSAEELAGLALEADVESRIVVGNNPEGPWKLRHGPFQENDFQRLPESDWTLLVQAVDLWVPEIKPLLNHFNFLPPWRLDDIMASYATTGGSVGPHFDQYDVFLIQVEGQRLWQVGDKCIVDTPLLAATDLKIVKDFQHTRQWLLNPGDMLYLPPRISHWGIAQTDCLTFSVGFRSPTIADMLGDLAIELAAQGNNDIYTDPPLTTAMACEEIHPAFIEQAKTLLHALLDNDELLQDWFARFMTATLYPGLEEQTREQRTASIGERVYRNGDLLS